MSFVFVIAILVPFFLCVPILIGIYVYRDARRRGMHAPLWTLIAILTPSLFGFLIYLLVRSGHSDLKCPQCSSSVTEHFAVCPQCGTRLKAACPNCSATLEPEWKLCPQCGQTLATVSSSCTPPVRHRDRWIGKILAAVILLPIVFLLILFLAFQATTRTGAMNTTYLTADSYLEAKADHWDEKRQEEVQLWLDSCLSAPDRAYALRHELDHNEQHIVQYLVYYPAADLQVSIDTDQNQTPFGSQLTVNFAHTEEPTGYNLCTVSLYTDRVPKLKVQNDGTPIEVEVTDVNYNLTLFELMSTTE